MKRKLAEQHLPPASTPPVAAAAASLQTPVKVKEEDLPLDFAPDGKKRGSASRTGTACDRCRVRKMRCDDNPDGCASCRQAQTECKTTDRITGKATGRGYVDTLEGRIAQLERRNQELREHILSLGGRVPQDARDAQTARSRYSLTPNSALRDEAARVAARSGAQLEKGSSYDGGTGSVTPESFAERRNPLPPSRKGLHSNNYFGISSGNSLLSSVRGTSMNVLGMEIELTDYLSPDVDEPDLSRGTQPIYNKSYRAFIQTAFGMCPRLKHVELPARSEGLHYAEVFLRVTIPFVPIVHKPSFLNLLARMYDDQHFKPTSAETVMVHAGLAIAYCQYASRGAKDANHQAELNRASNFHYHYALGFFPELMASHTLADVQALGLLCIFLRNCPKPGASWMLTSIVLDLAIELGLHRSHTNWAPTVKKNLLEIEMRKRVFWSINWIHVLVGGSLGRPMALRAGDWDVEIPEPVDDELLNENGLDTSHPGTCRFLAGIENFKILPIYMDLYNIIYAVGATPPNYEDTVRSLEHRLREWYNQWPGELYDAAALQNEVGKVQKEYLHLWRCHVQLLLRHPSLSPTTSAEFNTESLTICLDTTKDLLSHVKALQMHRGLDITWQTSALFILAIATTLYGRWERRSSLTLQDFNELKRDMGDWLSIMSDMDALIGAGGRLFNRTQTIIYTTLTNLSQSFISTAALPMQKSQMVQLPSHPGPHSTPIPLAEDFQSYQQFPPSKQEGQIKHDGSYTNIRGAGPPTAGTNIYPQRPQYHHHTAATAQSQGRNYQALPDQQSSLSANNSDNPSAPTPNYVSSFPPNSSTPYPNTFTPQPPASTPNLYSQGQAPGSPSSWRYFTGNVIPQWGSSQPDEYVPSASATVPVGQNPRNLTSAALAAPDIEPARGDVYIEGALWPGSLFEPNPRGR